MTVAARISLAGCSRGRRLLYLLATMPPPPVGAVDVPEAKTISDLSRLNDSHISSLRKELYGWAALGILRTGIAAIIPVWFWF